MGAVVLGALVCLVSIWITGCQVGTTGVLRPVSPEAEHAITNSVGIVTNVAGQAVPFPFGTGIELFGGVILSALAAWQALTHRAISKLKANGAMASKESKE